MRNKKEIFDRCFDGEKCLEIKNINYDEVLHRGTCMLSSRKCHYLLTWQIRPFPTESAGMPGSPYPVEVVYTISDKEKCDIDSLKSMTGRFVYEVPSGTLPQNSPLGIPFGEYHSLARNNNRNREVSVCMSLLENCLEVIVTKAKN